MIQLDQLPTEQQNPNTACIDRLSTLDMVRVINDEDKKVAFAVEKELVSIAAAVDAIYEALKAGGRLIYCGCGTSGRLGILDAVECPPTFSTDPEMVQGVIAGGAVRAVVEAAGIKNIRTKCLRSNNPQNVVAATMVGLQSLRNAQQVAAYRGKTADEIVG